MAPPTRTLVFYADADESPHLTTRGAAWHTEPYQLSPGADAPLSLPGGKYYLGGIVGRVGAGTPIPRADERRACRYC